MLGVVETGCCHHVRKDITAIVSDNEPIAGIDAPHIADSGIDGRTRSSDSRPRWRNSDPADSGSVYAPGAMLGRSRGVASSQLAEEPGLRGLPVRGAVLSGDVQDIRCLLDGQPAKESQFDNLTHTRIAGPPCAERIVGDEVALLEIRQLSARHRDSCEAHRHHVSGAAGCGRTPPDPSHHLRRDREEVRAIPPFDSIDVNPPQVHLVPPATSPAAYQWAAPHTCRRYLKQVELLIDLRDQSVEGGSVALTPRSEELGGSAVGIRRHDSFSGRMALL